MTDKPDMHDRVRELEEQQMFLERQVDVLSTEVRELSKLLEVARSELRRIEAEFKRRTESDGSGEK